MTVKEKIESLNSRIVELEKEIANYRNDAKNLNLGLNYDLTDIEDFIFDNEEKIEEIKERIEIIEMLYEDESEEYEE